MELILMRHGKAEDGMLHLADRDRQLTELGKERALQAARVLKDRLTGTAAVHIWSSPLRRARQTAEIVAAEFSGSVREDAAIARGDLDEVAEAWADLPEQDTLIVVGHEPDLGLWAARLANVVLPFRPGAAAAFRLDERMPPQGRLIWFVQSSIWAKL